MCLRPARVSVAVVWRARHKNKTFTMSLFRDLKLKRRKTSSAILMEGSPPDQATALALAVAAGAASPGPKTGLAGLA